MLPTANCTFKIPNLNDDLELNCRLHFPRRRSESKDVFVTGFAIFAHPYASLGGCYDDPIVQLIGAILLRRGFVLCTFNFRGAMGSPGRTSWTGRPELADYVSVYTFMLCLINAPEVIDYVHVTNGHPLMVLGGYSYGSMIASHVPDLQTVQSLYHPDKEGSSDHEINLRAQEIAKVLLGFIETQNHQGRHNSATADVPGTPSSRREVLMGGYDSDDANRRISRDAPRHSLDREQIRHSIDRVKHKLGRRAATGGDAYHSSTETVLSDPASLFPIEPTVSYLLVSPLLQPVAGLTTIFQRLKFERNGISNDTKIQKSISQNLSEHSTLAVFGDKDVFTTAHRLRKWTRDLQDIPNSQFRSEEVAGAGHFWHDSEASGILSRAVSAWLAALVKNHSTGASV